MNLHPLPRKPDLMLVPREEEDLLLEDGSKVAAFDDAEDPGIFFERVTRPNGAELWFLGILEAA